MYLLRTKLGFLRDHLRDMLTIHLSRNYVRSLTSKDYLPRAPQATESHLHTMPFVKT